MVDNTQLVADVSEPEPKANPPSALKKLAARGAVWSFAGYGTKQVLRFANQLILADLLVPKIFGQMALVNVFIVGLEMLSDIGINHSVVQNKRGDDPDFLNTAWTMQIIRGLLLGILACGLAWPMSQFFNVPILLYAIPISGFVAVFRGFNASKLIIAQRELNTRMLVAVELSSYIIGIIVMVVWAYVSPSIWVLVAGALTTSLTELILTHTILKGHQNKLYFDRKAFDEIYRFGRWIFISTAFTFLVVQSDRLIIGRLMGDTFLGLYFVALTFASMVQQAIMQMGYKVFFPSFSRIIRDNPSQLYGLLRQARIALITLSWLGALMYIFLGYQLIEYLYPSDYHDAGWILRMLAAGSLVGVLSYTYDHVLIAKGETFTVAFLNAVQLVLQIVGMIIGERMAGQFGIVAGFAAVGWLIYPFKALWVAHHKVWQPEVDLPVVFGAITIVSLVFVFV
ncbi:MAG: oligosaccharide flippase family protein [Candidatus Promineifilaceae bacterium]